jgi:hypothetical protein
MVPLSVTTASAASASSVSLARMSSRRRDDAARARAAGVPCDATQVSSGRPRTS